MEKIKRVNKNSIYKYLATSNNHEYNILKAAEELQELSLILTQKVNKPLKVKDSNIIEEIGDVEIRLKVLKELYPKRNIKARIKYKIEKYLKYIKDGKYKNI